MPFTVSKSILRTLLDIANAVVGSDGVYWWKVDARICPPREGEPMKDPFIPTSGEL